MRRGFAVALLALLMVGGVTASAEARTWRKKAIWGPVTKDGRSQFPIYRRMGASIYQTSIPWSAIATRRPTNPTDPNDPAYSWRSSLDLAVSEARRYRLRLMVNVTQAPGWANGGRSSRWSPLDPQDYADFVTAASRRYPSIRLWMIWGEASRRGSFMPMPTRGGSGPRRYARILDLAYGALKRSNRRNLVIGGNTFVTGDVAALRFLREMRLSRRRRPRFDLWGHNPFSSRRPRLSDRALCCNYADFGTLDTLARDLDRYYPRRRKKLYLAEYTVPTGKRSYLFNFATRQRTAASWLGSAMRIARRWNRIYALGWYRLYDDPPDTKPNPANIGLLDWRGRKKPAYWAYRRG